MNKIKSFKIFTSCTCFSSYIVKAKNKEEAIDKYWDGEYTDEHIDNYQDETVDEVEEIKEENNSKNINNSNN